MVHKEGPPIPTDPEEKPEEENSEESFGHIQGKTWGFGASQKHGGFWYAELDDEDDKEDSGDTPEESI